MGEIYLIVTVDLGRNIVNFETGSGSSTREHHYAYKTIGAARRQLGIMKRQRLGSFGVTEETLAIAAIKNTKIEFIYE